MKTCNDLRGKAQFALIATNALASKNLRKHVANGDVAKIKAMLKRGSLKKYSL